MTAPDNDFYAPAPDHRRVVKERLGRQRDAMFAWRSDHGATTFHPVTGERCAKVQGYEDRPRQVLLQGSEREAALREKERKRAETTWRGAAGHHVDRRREWRVTGFQFDRAHFRTSEDPRSVYHPSRKTPLRAPTLAEKRAAIAADPYEPYFHDAITLCQPPTGAQVTSFAVTRNAAEAEAREKDGAQQTQNPSRSQSRSRHGGSMDGESESSNNWCNVLGASISAKQRSVQLAETMYGDLALRQSAAQAGPGPAPPRLQVPTGELAFSLRPTFVERLHSATRHGRHSAAATSRGGAAAGSSAASAPSPTPEDRQHTSPTDPEGDFSAAEEEEDGAEAAGLTGGGADAMQLTGGAQEGDRLLPAEAKSERLYAVELRRTLHNKDAAMGKRQERQRKGVPVTLPDSWLSPMTYH